jgi:hypothetical protein
MEETQLLEESLTTESLAGPTPTLSAISDEEANDIYLRMAAQSSSSKGFIKKNWAEDETKLLRWAVVTYTRQKSINYNNLVSVLLTHHLGHV